MQAIVSSSDLNNVLRRILELQSATPKALSAGSILVQTSSNVPAGRGLVYSEPVVPGQTLLTLSRDSLINVKSYSDHFHPDILPSDKNLSGTSLRTSESTLTSSQALSLLVSRTHIASCLQPGRNQTKKGEALQLFVKTLPVAFETLPLSWLSCSLDADKSHGQKQFYERLTQALPRHSQKLLHDVHGRFERDWTRIQSLLATDPDKLAEPHALLLHPSEARAVVTALDYSTFLWAWSCVNTRCVFLPLQLAEYTDNFTLVPILDMANHTSDIALECKVNFLADGGLSLCSPEASNKTSKVSIQGLKAGDECFIAYGSHSNESLVSEYGFCLPRTSNSFHSTPDKDEWTGNRYANVLIDEDVEIMLKEEGSEGERKIELLQDRGYWGDFSLHPYPAPPHPSHRLVPALRLLPLSLPLITASSAHAPQQAKRSKSNGANAKSLRDGIEATTQKDLRKWEATLTGHEDRISAENEQQAHLALVSLCQRKNRATQEARRHAKQAQHILDTILPTELSVAELKGCEASLSMVRQLLDEEESILMLVMQAAERQTEW